MLRVMAVLCAAWMVLLVKADDRKEDVKHAVRILKGLDGDRSREWAFSVLAQASEEDGMAYAMNSLGLAYMAGAGVERDTAKAVMWLEKAGASGYAEAYHNLGILYKKSLYGVSQDFCKSCHYFAKGREVGSMRCTYDLGFMYYKGLGCTQSYERAAELFRSGADADYTPSLYMLGLCYRNGYGVEQDTARSSFYLGRAAMMGYKEALEEMHRPTPENSYAVSTAADVPLRMPSVSPSVNDTSLLPGRWEGYVILYDWSGGHVIGEKPVFVDLARKTDGLCGVMVLGNDTIPFTADINDKGMLDFRDVNLQLWERYNPRDKTHYRMEKACLDIWNRNLRGKLSLYSLDLKEPERPMYMELLRVDAASNSENRPDGNQENRISISPNPFADSFTATFVLHEESAVRLRMFDTAGILVFDESLGRMAEGKHTVVLSPSLRKGSYVLNVTAGNQVLRSIITKK